MPGVPNPLQTAGDQSAPGTGSAAVDLSSTDAVYGDATTPGVPQSLYITGAGDVKFTGVDGSIDTLTLPANFVLPIAVVKVFKTGTTATGIHAWFRRPS